MTPVEQQFLIDALRFETSQLQPAIQENVLVQLNRISHDVAVRVGDAIGLRAPEADSTYYHDNTTADISIFGQRLPTIATLQVGVLVSARSNQSLADAVSVQRGLAAANVTAVIIGETLTGPVGVTYSAAQATAFDGIIVTEGARALIDSRRRSSLYPTGRPGQIVTDSYNWGKPVAFLGGNDDDLAAVGASSGPGVYVADSFGDVLEDFQEGLAIFKFTDRFPLDE